MKTLLLPSLQFLTHIFNISPSRPGKNPGKLNAVMDSANGELELLNHFQIFIDFILLAHHILQRSEVRTAHKEKICG